MGQFRHNRGTEPPARTCSEKMSAFQLEWRAQFGKTPRDWHDRDAIAAGESTFPLFEAWIEDGRTDMTAVKSVLRSFGSVMPSYNDFRSAYMGQRGEQAAAKVYGDPHCPLCHGAGKLWKVEGPTGDGTVRGVNPSRKDVLPMPYAFIVATVCNCERSPEKRDKRIPLVYIREEPVARAYAVKAVALWKEILEAPDRDARMKAAADHVLAIPKVVDRESGPAHPQVTDADFQAARDAFPVSSARGNQPHDDDI